MIEDQTEKKAKEFVDKFSWALDIAQPGFRYSSDTDIPQLTRGSEDAAGYDIASTESAKIPPHSAKLFHTGLHVAIPRGFVGILKSRSGNAVKRGIEVGAGVIDSDYRGEICVLLHNMTDVPVFINMGDRIAQMILLQHGVIQRLIRVDKLDDTERGSSGFGSTGGVVGGTQCPISS